MVIKDIFVNFLDSRTKKILFFCICVFIVLIIVHPFILRLSGRFLIYDTDFESADIAIVLSGAGGSRVKKAVDIYKKNKVPGLLMTGGPIFLSSYSEYMSEYAQHLGVPSKDIMIETMSFSTKDNAVNSFEKISDMDLESVVIVTSKFHTRRSYEVFTKVFGNSDIKIYIAGADDNIDYDNWWKSHDMIERIFIEWAKYIWYKVFILSG
ncbi:MAG: YdcF family protein [bacterium]|nr:YdcF family protein [bacterium]